MVHVGEGVDARAAEELARFEALTCLRPNSVIVHGVALTPDRWTALVAAGASLVWCPASNVFLFGRTLPLRACLDATPDAVAHVCLGTDSRLTGSRDLLDELRIAARTRGVQSRRAAADGHDIRGARLEARDGRPDRRGWTGGPDGHSTADRRIRARWRRRCSAPARRDVRLVMVGGRPMVASPMLKAVFAARRSRPRPLRVDGVERLADPRLAAAIERCPIREPGVEIRLTRQRRPDGERVSASRRRAPRRCARIRLAVQSASWASVQCTGRRGDARPPLRIAQQRENRVGERCRRRRCHRHRPIGGPVRKIADRGSHRRHAAGRRLERHDPGRFMAGREHAEMRALVQRDHCVGRQKPVERHVTVDTEVSSQALHRTGQRVVTDDVQMDVDELRPHALKGSEQRRLILHRIEIGGVHRGATVARPARAAGANRVASTPIGTTIGVAPWARARRS